MMKNLLRIAVVIGGLAASLGVRAQTPAGAPAGATGRCKDGTYATGLSRTVACKGHRGVKDWYVVSQAAESAKITRPASGDVSVPSVSPLASPRGAEAVPAESAASSSASKPVVPGGGPGLVWVNTVTKVYHCPGTRFYGKTAEGKYMAEADAKAMGAHASRNVPCGK